MGQALDDGGFVEERKIQLGLHGADQIDAGHELLHLVVEQGKFEPSFAIGFGQAKSRSRRIKVALVFMMENEIVKADELHCRNPFVSPIKHMLHLGIHLFGKHLFNPFALCGGGEAE